MTGGQPSNHSGGKRGQSDPPHYHLVKPRCRLALPLRSASRKRGVSRWKSVACRSRWLPQGWQTTMLHRRPGGCSTNGNPYITVIVLVYWATLAGISQTALVSTPLSASASVMTTRPRARVETPTRQDHALRRGIPFRFWRHHSSGCASARRCNRAPAELARAVTNKPETGHQICQDGFASGAASARRARGRRFHRSWKDDG